MSQFGATRSKQNQRMTELRLVMKKPSSTTQEKKTAASEIKALKQQMLQQPPANLFNNVAYMKWRHENSNKEYLERVELAKPAVLDFMLLSRADEELRKRSLSVDGLSKILPPVRKADMLSSVNFVKAAGESDITTMRALLKKGVAVNCIDPLTGRGNNSIN